MADAAAKAALKKKRTFRKYSYRGIDLDQLLDLSHEQVTPAATFGPGRALTAWLNGSNECADADVPGSMAS